MSSLNTIHQPFYALIHNIKYKVFVFREEKKMGKTVKINT